MKTTLIFLIQFTFLSLAFISCQKDDASKNKLNNFINGGGFKSKSGDFKANVYFDAGHNVLVFPTIDDVRYLEDEIHELESNFPYDKGNTDLIFDVINDIKIYGYTNGNGNPHNKVKIKEFEILLNESYPLSDTVLNELIDLNDNYRTLPPPFMRDVFSANTQFGNDVKNGILNGQIPQGIKNQIIEAHLLDVVGVDFGYNEFLKRFPSYRSLYQNLLDQEKVDLLSGKSPMDPSFDNDFIRDDFLRLILNENREVYIGKSLYKYYDSCKLVKMSEPLEEAYSSLNTLNTDGSVGTIPNYNETNAGLPISVIDGHVPTEMQQAHADVIDPQDFEGTDMAEANNSLRINPSYCATSTFTYFKPAYGQSVDFTSFTQENMTPGYIKYWTFGDGTGSFLDNPSHFYNSPGTYEVKLTTFTPDCGCWQVNRRIISVEEGEVSANCIITLEENLVNYSINFSYTEGSTPQDDLVESTISFKIWDSDPSNSQNNPIELYSYDGSYGPIARSSLPTIITENPGEYFITVQGYFESGGCNGPVFSESIPILIGSDECCDRRATYRYKDNDNKPYKREFTMGSTQCASKMYVKAVGNSLNQNNRVKATLKFYTKSNFLGITYWKKTKAQLLRIGFNQSNLSNIDENRKCIGALAYGFLFSDLYQYAYDEKCLQYLDRTKPVDVSDSEGSPKFGMPYENSLQTDFSIQYEGVVDVYTINLGKCD